MKKRACGWPHYFYYYGAPDAKELEVVRYYDTANFARCLISTRLVQLGI